jgi:hypothetical protein
LEALDLPVEANREATHIVALMPREAKRRRGRVAAKSAESSSGSGANLVDESVKEKQAALVLLKKCLTQAFSDRVAMQHEAAKLTRYLARFRHTYHVSEFASKEAPLERLWFSGRLQLECTANFHLSGTVMVGHPVGEPIQIRVFGRPVKLNKGKVWNLNWRSTDLHEESGTMNLFVSESDLERGEALVGHWVGRSSWTEGDVRPTGGPYILHTRSGLSPRELGRLVKQHQDANLPNLKLAAQRLVPLNKKAAAISATPQRIASSRRKTARAKTKRVTKSVALKTPRVRSR